jgi:hypothetical protein
VLVVSFAVTYFNGTDYKEVIQPFHLQIGPHFNNGFESAEEIGLNQSARAFVAAYGLDTADYYKTWLQDGTSVAWLLSYPGVQAIEIRVYDPDMQLRSCLECPTNSSSKQLIVTVGKAGWWYTRLNTVTAEFVYTLTISNRTG